MIDTALRTMKENRCGHTMYDDRVKSWGTEAVRFRVWNLLLLYVLVMPVRGEIIVAREEQMGLGTWEWRQSGVSLQLIQRLPDQTRAFFQGRGFSANDADLIGRACVFQTIFRNDGQRRLRYDLDDWGVVHQGRRYPLRTRERWEDHWSAGGVSEAARIAMRWSFLPTRQGFEPGDYNWGMTSFGLAPGESFDLVISVMIDEETLVDRIPALTCPEDLP